MRILKIQNRLLWIEYDNYEYALKPINEISTRELRRYINRSLKQNKIKKLQSWLKDNTEVKIKRKKNSGRSNIFIVVNIV